MRADLETRLGVPVTIDNDVNLAAVAEQRDGAARGASDFVLLWVGRGIGSAIVMGGEVHRGASGAAGELGYLPVPGVELPRHISRRDKGAFQRLAGEEAILEAARSHGVAATALRSAIGSGDPDLLDDVAHRLAVGVAAVCAVVDPGLVVLSGPGRAGGRRRAVRARRPGGRRPSRPCTRGSCSPTWARPPVLRGAHLVALDGARHLVAAG